MIPRFESLPVDQSARLIPLVDHAETPLGADLHDRFAFDRVEGVKIHRPLRSFIVRGGLVPTDDLFACKVTP